LEIGRPRSTSLQSGWNCRRLASAASAFAEGCHAASTAAAVVAVAIWTLCHVFGGILSRPSRFQQTGTQNRRLAPKSWKLGAKSCFTALQPTNASPEPRSVPIILRRFHMSRTQPRRRIRWTDRDRMPVSRMLGCIHHGLLKSLLTREPRGLSRLMCATSLDTFFLNA
jgi:hypothetical protein